MRRYIDADKLKKDLIIPCASIIEIGKAIMVQIDEQPTADVIEVVRCKDCIYYDPPHVEDHGKRLEYKDLPKEAFDDLGTGLVSLEYGINVGGRCYRDYNAGYSEDKRIYVSESNYCGRAERTDK